MFLVVLVAAIIGVFVVRFWEYWQWVIIAFIWAVLATIFLATGGSDLSSAGDGMLSFLVRRFVGPQSVETWILTGLNSVAWIILLVILIRAVYAAWQIYRSDRVSEFVSSNRKWAETFVFAVILGLCQLPSLIGKPANFSAPLASLFGLPTAAASQDEVAQQMLAASIEENKALPRQIDNITTLTATSVEGRVWTFHYSINLSADQRDRAIEFATETAPRTACSDQLLRPNMQSNQVTYVFEYLFGDNPEPHFVPVDEDVCKALEA